jgi:hypothetical protein
MGQGAGSNGGVWAVSAALAAGTGVAVTAAPGVAVGVGTGVAVAAAIGVAVGSSTGFVCVDVCMAAGAPVEAASLASSRAHPETTLAIARASNTTTPTFTLDLFIYVLPSLAQASRSPASTDSGPAYLLCCSIIAQLWAPRIDHASDMPMYAGTR